jgi:hypothetical protein
MKVFNNFYDEMVSHENLFNAWQSFKSGKTRKSDVAAFEYQREVNLFKLYEDLMSQKYKHGGYERFFVNDQKRREIHKSTIRDRVVHVLLARALERMYQPNFIANSFACQTDKGIHYALRRVTIAARRFSLNYTRNFWYLKCDIKKFFDNIDHVALVSILRKKVKDEKFLWLMDEVIDSFFKNNTERGLPLGNFTSQWLANVYLNELDYFAKHALKIKHYFRYSDDILIFGETRGYLLDKLNKIRLFLTGKLSLVLHENKIFIKKFGQGIDFVGYRILPHHVIMKSALKRRMLRKMKERKEELSHEYIGSGCYVAALNSYCGWLKHCCGHKLQNELLYQNLD